jgi:hypothetical protein
MEVMIETAVSDDAVDSRQRVVLFDFDGVLLRGDAFAEFVRSRFRRSDAACGVSTGTDSGRQTTEFYLGGCHSRLGLCAVIDMVQCTQAVACSRTDSASTMPVRHPRGMP